MFAKYTHKENMTLQDVKSQATQKQNPIQRVIKSLSDVFIEIMPAILAAALLMGLSGLLGQQGLFGKKSIVEMVPMLAGLNRFISIVSSSVFSILPLIVVWSSTKKIWWKSHSWTSYWCFDVKQQSSRCLSGSSGSSKSGNNQSLRVEKFS